MSYKRLTKEKSTSENTKIVYNENGFAIFDKELVEKLLEEHNRLWELEDKIENGTIIELPCKVGTTVYYIGSLEVRAFFKIKTIHDIVEMPFSLDMLDSYKIVWFTTKAEAEKKLEELSKKP